MVKPRRLPPLRRRDRALSNRAHPAPSSCCPWTCRARCAVAVRCAAARPEGAQGAWVERAARGAAAFAGSLLMAQASASALLAGRAWSEG